jgi:hypothetical protein
MQELSSGCARPAPGVALVFALAMVVCAPPASAFPLRSPQIVFQNAALQGFFNSGWDPGVNAELAQLDVQSFSSPARGPLDWNLLIKVGSFTGLHTIGVYNTGSANPKLYELLPDSALAEDTVHCKFFGAGVNAGRLLVARFNASGFLVDTTSFAGVTRDAFGFYIQGAGGTKYTPDFRNGGLPQMLAYQGTGINAQDLWLCFEDKAYAPSASTFDSVVLQMQSVFQSGGCPGASSSAPGFFGVECTPTVTSTWGHLKAIYR